MSGEVYRDRGSKRRIRIIRWKRSEVLSAILIAVGAIGLCIAVTVWMMTHPFD
jgi:hypothetical protein